MKRVWLAGAVVAVGFAVAPLVGDASPQYGTENGHLACPRFAAAGTSVAVSGSGFGVGTVVSLRLDRGPAEPPSIVADTSGMIAPALGLPTIGRPGAHRITASGLSSGGDMLVLRCNIVVRAKPS